MKPGVYLHPAACPKAGVDLEKIGWILEEAGFGLVDEPAGATFGIVFGCGFIDDAKQESIEDILELVELKQRSQLRHIVFVGCLPQKHGKALALSLPEVDALVGVGGLYMLPMICKRILEGKLPGKVWDDDLTAIGDLGDIPYRVVPGARAWTRAVIICDGCDNACSYCAIPQMRGRLRSRDSDTIAEEVTGLARQGVKEIVLAGQDTASYGNDLGENGLVALLDVLAGQFPDTWLRLAYVMGRVGPALKKRKIAHLRDTVPDVALRTSVIVGFPGETEEDMELLLEFLASVEFDLVGVFAFSPQADTPAAGLPGKVPDEVKQERIMDVVSLQNEISRRKMEAMLGRDVTVLVDESDGPDCMGHSQYDMAGIDRTIRIAGCKTRAGELVTARLDAVAAPFEWTARLV